MSVVAEYTVPTVFVLNQKFISNEQNNSFFLSLKRDVFSFYVVLWACPLIKFAEFQYYFAYKNF